MYGMSPRARCCEGDFRVRRYFQEAIPRSAIRQVERRRIAEHVARLRNDYLAQWVSVFGPRHPLAHTHFMAYTTVALNGTMRMRHDGVHSKSKHCLAGAVGVSVHPVPDALARARSRYTSAGYEIYTGGGLSIYKLSVRDILRFTSATHLFNASPPAIASGVIMAIPMA
ncbi:hypothetical protein CPB85DRAFT_874442 [Mucidula mucida]|nr:hypothetical protein CPB85DRAFT_874442 [Mucidula mucida]